MSSIILYERIINKRERKMHAMIYFIENFDPGTLLFFVVFIIIFKTM